LGFAPALTVAIAARILLIPLGPVDSSVLRFVAHSLTERLPLTVDVLSPETLPSRAFDARRNQYNSSLILDDQGVRRRPDSGADFRVLVTDADLYAEGLSFAFGQADPASRTAVISLARLREEFYDRRASRRRLEERAAKEALHELGHLFGLGHCSNPGCVMFFSNSLADTDRKSADFCANCRRLLPAGLNRDRR
jgi:archaemetzincin